MRGHLLPLTAIFAVLILVGAGCVTIGGGGVGSQSDGGMFKTGNKGDVWASKSAVATTTGEKRSITGVAVGAIVQDPQDPNALYIGTAGNGLFYTYDGGESWQQPAQIGRGRVYSIAVHPKDKCTILATYENKLLRTDDCSRTWSVIYVDSRTDRQTKAVTIDSYNPSIVWLASSSGDLLKSADGGVSWAVSNNFSNDLVKVFVSPADTRRVFVATKDAGIWRTDDGGSTWADKSVGYKDYSGAREFSDMVFGVSDPNIVIFASKYGLLRSTDFGDTWQSIDLLAQPGSTLIYSLAIDPKDPNNIYYGTSTTFVRTANGGVNWTPKRLPTTRAATALLVDEADSGVIYMGVTQFKQ